MKIRGEKLSWLYFIEIKTKKKRFTLKTLFSKQSVHKNRHISLLIQIYYHHYHAYFYCTGLLAYMFIFLTPYE